MTTEELEKKAYSETYDIAMNAWSNCDKISIKRACRESYMIGYKQALLYIETYLKDKIKNG